MNGFHKFGRFSLASIVLASAIIFSGCPKKKALPKAKSPANDNSARKTTASNKVDNPTKKGALSREATQRSLNEILKRLDLHYKHLQSMRSNVTLISYNDQIRKSETNVGIISFLPKTDTREMYVRLDWIKPFQESFVVIGNEYRLFRPSLNIGYQGKLSTLRRGDPATGPLAFLNMSMSELKRQFIPEYIGSETLKDGVKTFHISVTPVAATFYKKADVWADADGCPRQVKVTETNGDAFTVQLSNIVKNMPINAAVFQLKFPKGTKVVRI